MSALDDFCTIQAFGAQLTGKCSDHIPYDLFRDLHMEEESVGVFAVTKGLTFRRGQGDWLGLTLYDSLPSSGFCRRFFDHLVRPRQHVGWYRDFDLFRCFQIDF